MRKFWLTSLLLLSSCVSLPPLPPLPAAQLQRWQLQGRIVVSTPEDTWTAKVYWQQQDQAYQLRFNNPVGQGVFRLEGNEQQVVMQTADKKRFSADNPDTLVAETLQVNIPVTHLNFWIRGIPSPQPAPRNYQLNAAGQLTSLQQDNWQIEYKRYIQVQQLYLPQKLFLENDRFQVKIVITQWQLNPPNGVAVGAQSALAN
jgi:outer membrane lipoprotein LolB